MALVRFTANLQQHLACPEVYAEGGTVIEVLESAFRENPRVRGYVLDDRGVLRRHMTVFVNGSNIRDREKLSDPVPDGAEVYVMQALSGG
ncbi:MAG: MoaD/ThiS family protein [Planctomycetes bacterium]|nr:MoaD/ThiS family protein [Planctomycetota bacterium]